MSLDRFDCYELCVQSPRHVAAFLYAVHGQLPTVLREDFCGTAAVARYWCRQAAKRGDRGRAIGVDLDPDVLAKARALAAAEGGGVNDRLSLARSDATAEDSAPGLRGVEAACDLVFVGNFSIGYIHERTALVEYLRRSKARLDRGQGGFGGGVFVCDTYGGAAAFKLGGITRTHPARGRETIRYHWVHERADPLTGIVENSISFRVEIDGEVVHELPRAFVYRWRLWSIHELREAMMEAGFGETAVYTDVNIAPGEMPVPVHGPEDLGEDWIVLVVGRA
jgi:SAM-dependent methyltransferase